MTTVECVKCQSLRNQFLNCVIANNTMQFCIIHTCALKIFSTEACDLGQTHRCFLYLKSSYFHFKISNTNFMKFRQRKNPPQIPPNPLVIPAWFSSWWGWSQSSSTPSAAPPHGQRWHARCRRPQPAGCHLQTRPGWTRCLCWVSPVHRTTGKGQKKKIGESATVNG